VATVTITIAAVASIVDATDPGLISTIVDDVANNISIGGKPVAASGTATATINEISTAITYTVVKS